MHYQALPPHPLLQDYLSCYFFLRTEQDPPSEQLIIPDGTPGLMFVQHARFTRYCPTRPGGRRQVAGSYLFGQKTRPVHYAFDTPGLDCFAVKFQPHGLNACMKMPASELTDTMTESAGVLGKHFSELEERLFTARGVAEKKELLDRYFISRLLPGTAPDYLLVRKILSHIHRQQGQVDIAGLLPAFRLSHKRLERLFKKYVGIGPKTYCCITRFHATLLLYQRHWPGSLTQLAYSSGYFDQMHFIKEVKHFTHLAPKEFYKNGPGEIGLHQWRLVMERFA